MTLREATLYSTCLFCTTSLGRNESLEHFPVGPRLAYDAANGRLWVVCRRCERWNLTPLEVRWEAIEEAERAFRGARHRVATDNIALARLTEGLELVRIGAPPRLELATWRYGDQFGRRRRKHAVLTVSGSLVMAMPTLGTLLGPAAFVSTLAVVGFTTWDMRRTRRESRVPVVFVRDVDGRTHDLTHVDATTAALERVPEVGDWCLTIDRAERPLPLYGRPFARTRRIQLRGDHAERALAQVLPHVNSWGAGARKVRQAVEVLGGVASARQLIRRAADAAPRASNVRHTLGGLPGSLPLALEMALHEDDERRAMEGELAALEARWREAEEVAAIADSLLLPDDAAARLEALRREAEASTR